MAPLAITLYLLFFHWHVESFQYVGNNSSTGRDELGLAAYEIDRSRLENLLGYQTQRV